MEICEIRAPQMFFVCSFFSQFFLCLKRHPDSLQGKHSALSAEDLCSTCRSDLRFTMTNRIVINNRIFNTNLIGYHNPLINNLIGYFYLSQLTGHCFNPLKHIETIISSFHVMVPRSVPSAFDLLHPGSPLLVRSHARLGFAPPICSFAAMGSIPFLG